MKYPIGATWQAKNDRRQIATIKLSERHLEKYEIWDWYLIYDDGSGLRHDRCSSYKKCKDEMAFSNQDFTTPRFKRIA